MGAAKLSLIPLLLAILSSFSQGGQRLCEIEMRLCPTGLCKINECLKCDYEAICETTNPHEVIPKGLIAKTGKLDLSYHGPEVELNSDMFSHIRKLLHIKITGNITSIAPNTFVNMRHMKTLTITETKLKSLPDQAFSNSTRFKFLNLTRNQFREIPVNAFLNMSSIERLDLSYNPLSICKNHTLPLEFKELKHLNELRLAGQGTDSKELCTNVSKGFFLPVKNISNLDLSESPIFYGDQRLLSPLVNLRILWIDNVPRYKECPAAAAELLQNIPPKVNELTLKKWASQHEVNQSCLFTSDILNPVKQLIKLSVLDFRGSDKIFGNYLAASLFEGFQRLKSVFINWCGMATIESGAFNSAPTLTSLGVGGNLLGSRELKLYTGNQTAKLKTLSLNSIGINTVTYNASNVLLSFPNLNMLYLDNNLLKRIPDFGYSQNVSTRLTKLTLNKNQIRTLSADVGKQLCTVLPALNVLKMELNLLKDVSGIQYCHSSLQQLHLANNFVAENLHINFKAIGKLSKLRHLDLSFNKIKYLTPDLLVNLTNLHTLILASNLIETLDRDLFINTPNLKVLDLSSNFLLAFDRPLITTQLPQLVSLFLQANQITRLSADLVGSFSNHKTLKRIGLAGNPLTCSCDDYLSKWVKNSTIIMQVKNLTCSTPENRNETTRVLDYTPNYFYCFVKSLLMISGIVIACVATSLVIAIPCYKYRWYVKHPVVVARAVLERLKEVQFDQKCEYDAFISYDTSSDTDSSWIINHLIPAIENVTEEDSSDKTVSSN